MYSFLNAEFQPENIGLILDVQAEGKFIWRPLWPPDPGD
jgi:hypothetical protein